MSNTRLPVSAGGNGDAEGTTAPGDGAPESATAATALDAGQRSRLVWLAALSVVVVDQLTKIWAVAALDDRTIDLFWTLRLRLIRNTGASFGLGEGFGRWLALLVIVVIVAVVRYARKVHDRATVIVLGVILGGAVGNLIDRLVRADDGFLSGGVVDFVDFQWWPVFNVADMAVVCGAGVLVLLSGRAPS